MMSNSKTYNIFVFSFLLLFSFFHVGYAAVEYICSMGMEMDNPVCSGCHPENHSPAHTVAFSPAGNSSCCDSVVKKTEMIDEYTNTKSNLTTDLEFHISHLGIFVKPENTCNAVYTLGDEPVLPHYNLHGISTSIQYTSSLR